MTKFDLERAKSLTWISLSDWIEALKEIERLRDALLQSYMDCDLKCSYKVPPPTFDEAYEAAKKRLQDEELL